MARNIINDWTDEDREAITEHLMVSAGLSGLTYRPGTGHARAGKQVGRSAYVTINGRSYSRTRARHFLATGTDPGSEGAQVYDKYAQSKQARGKRRRRKAAEAAASEAAKAVQWLRPSLAIIDGRWVVEADDNGVLRIDEVSSQ